MNTVSNNGLSPDTNRRDSRGFDSSNFGEANAGEPGLGEDTLRLIATLPAPDGLADRVKAGLRSAPRAGRILIWPGPLLPVRGWMYTNVARGAAAAAIVCVVAGGGWRIYSRVQQSSPSADVIVMPAPAVPVQGRFTESNAPRRPNTLDGPQLTHPIVPTTEINPVEKMPAQPNTLPNSKPIKRKKSSARSASSPVR